MDKQAKKRIRAFAWFGTKAIRRREKNGQALSYPLSLLKCVLFGVILSIFSSFSVCLFYYIHTTDEIEKYYSDASLSIANDVFQKHHSLLFILLPFLLAVFFFSFRWGKLRGIGVWLTSLPLGFNMIVSLSMEHSNLRQIFLPSNSIMSAILLNLAVLLGFCALLSVLIGWIFSAIDRKKNVYSLSRETQWKSEYCFAIAFAIIFVGWAPGMILSYPGTLRQDTLWQIGSYLGKRKMESSNPILTTVFYGWMATLGQRYGSNESSVFKIIVLQALVNAIAMSLVCERTYKYTKSKVFFLVSALYYSISPVWENAAQQAVKDVIHTGWYLLFYLQFLSCLENRKVSVYEIIWLCFTAIMVSFTRKAAFYLAVLCILILIIVEWKKRWKAYCCCLAVVVVLFMGCEKVLIPMLKIEKPREQENYSLQFQQIALYCIEHGDELTEDELRIINGTLNYDIIVEKYTPMISDGVKATYHGKKEAHDEFWALFYRLMFKHPLTFLKGLVMGSFEHINPWYDGGLGTGGTGLSQADYFHTSFPNKAKYVKMISRYWQAWTRYPVARLFCGNGLAAWILIVMFGYALRKRSLRTLRGLSLDLFLLAGLFMSHVNGMLRYGYPLDAAPPLVCAFTVYIASINHPIDISLSNEKTTKPVTRKVQLQKMLEDTINNQSED